MCFVFLWLQCMQSIYGGTWHYVNSFLTSCLTSFLTSCWTSWLTSCLTCVRAEYTEMVGNLDEAFQLAVDRYLESDPSSDEEVTVKFPAPEPTQPAHKQRTRVAQIKGEMSIPESTPRLVRTRERGNDGSQCGIDWMHAGRTSPPLCLFRMRRAGFAFGGFRRSSTGKRKEKCCFV